MDLLSLGIVLNMSYITVMFSDFFSKLLSSSAVFDYRCSNSWIEMHMKIQSGVFFVHVIACYFNSFGTTQKQHIILLIKSNAFPSLISYKKICVWNLTLSLKLVDRSVLVKPCLKRVSLLRIRLTLHAA